MLEKWREFVGGMVVHKTSRICTRHFVQDDIVSYPGAIRIQLSKEAIPSLFPRPLKTDHDYASRPRKPVHLLIETRQDEPIDPDVATPRDLRKRLRFFNKREIKVSVVIKKYFRNSFYFTLNFSIF